MPRPTHRAESHRAESHRAESHRDDSPRNGSRRVEPAADDRGGTGARAERRRWRRNRFVLVIAGLPLLAGLGVSAAVASPPDRPPTATASASASETATPAAPTASETAVPPVTPNPNCTLTVPAAPLTARGLATPYRLSATDPAQGPCDEADPAQSAFVQATVYDPATGALSVYDPLVVDAGRPAAARPVVPALPAGAVVGIWFGYNAGELTLRAAGNGLALAHCVNGLGSSLFTQYAYCDATAFFAAVNRGIAQHRLAVPPVGTAVDGRPCPTTRDFAIVDQDQSDNVTTQYLAVADGATAQDTPANAARLRGAAVLANPSDNALVDEFVDPTLGCTPWRVRDLSDGSAATALALDEIQANADQGAPVALVPLNDPMTTVSGSFSTEKTDLYRAGVDQPPLPAGQGPKTYCRDLDRIQTVRLEADLARFQAAPSPDPAAATDLLAFLGDRLHASFGNLGCAGFGLANPVSSETIDSAGAVTAVTFARSAP